MALAAAKPDPATLSLRAGIVMVSNQLKSTLAEAGLEEIDATDKMFDPALHEAVPEGNGGGPRRPRGPANSQRL